MVPAVRVDFYNADELKVPVGREVKQDAFLVSGLVDSSKGRNLSSQTGNVQGITEGVCHLNLI